MIACTLRGEVACWSVEREVGENGTVHGDAADNRSYCPVYSRKRGLGAYAGPLPLRQDGR